MNTNMNRATHPGLAQPVDIDPVLHPTYLLVTELRYSPGARLGENLKAHCTKLVETARKQLEAAGLSARSVEHISHAQCALLDDVVLHCTEDAAHEGWASAPLQAKFFGRLQGGESLYEDIKAVLAEPAPDVQVLTVFHRVLMLGFRGRFAEVVHPERDALLLALDRRVASLKCEMPPRPRGRERGLGLWNLPLPVQAVLAGCLVVTAWWLLAMNVDGTFTRLIGGHAS